MADLGVVGRNGLTTTGDGNALDTGFGHYRSVVIGTQELWAASGKDSDGDPGPSQKQGRLSILKDIWWPVAAGTRTIKISVKYSPATPVPKLIIKANPAIGVNADVVGTAPAGTQFVTIGPLVVTPTSDGVLQVWREWRGRDMAGFAKWDNIAVT